MKYLSYFPVKNDYTNAFNNSKLGHFNVTLIEDTGEVIYDTNGQIVCRYECGDESIKIINSSSNVESEIIDGELIEDVVANYRFTQGTHTVVFNLKNYRVFSSSMFSSCPNLVSVDIISEVDSIAKNGFSSCVNLKRVSICKGTTIINNNAFTGCTSLEEVIMPNSITTIGSSAFANTSISAITLSAGLVSIGSSAFMKCGNLEKVEFRGNNLSSVGQQAFQNCTKLQEIQFPDSTESFGTQVFMGCTLLKRIYIGQNVTSFGNRCLANTAVEYIDGNAANDSHNAIIIDNVIKAAAPSLTSFIVPNNITNIDQYGFGYCKSLMNFTIGNGVSNLASNAMYGRSALNEIDAYPTTAPTIASYTFNSVKKNGLLKHKPNTDYSSWMLTTNSYLGYLGWTDSATL